MKRVLSRRDVFTAAAAIAAAPFVLRQGEAAQRPSAADDAGTLERSWREGEILARVAFHSGVLTTAMGVLAMIQAYL